MQSWSINTNAVEPEQRTEHGFVAGCNLPVQASPAYMMRVATTTWLMKFLQPVRSSLLGPRDCVFKLEVAGMCLSNEFYCTSRLGLQTATA